MIGPLPAVAEPIGRKLAKVAPEAIDRARAQADELTLRHSLRPAVAADVLATILRAYAIAHGVKA